MSWTIYGTPLKPGHCEVHPDVAQPFPCSVCERERDVDDGGCAEAYCDFLRAEHERRMQEREEAAS